MSHMGELNSFLGLQIKQLNEGIFIYQEKYCKDLIKRFGMSNTTSKPTPMSTSIHLDKVESGMDLE